MLLGEKVLSTRTARQIKFAHPSQPLGQLALQGQPKESLVKILQIRVHNLDPT